MMLKKGWFKRRAAAPVPSTVVLEFVAVDLEAEFEGHGTYYIERCGDEGWSVRFRWVKRRPDERDLPIDAVDREGQHADWPTRGTAEAACRLHAHLLDLGYGPTRAAQLVTDRLRLTDVPQREDTLDYLVPVVSVSEANT
ncbi:MAG TPA: hypothetical protein VED01_03360 [Burkholderiales bacterium]|nr:hypothetical protein [Burkholderiales bacterium]